jgi:hypothetical protein
VNYFLIFLSTVPDLPHYHFLSKREPFRLDFVVRILSFMCFHEGEFYFKT